MGTGGAHYARLANEDKKTIKIKWRHMEGRGNMNIVNIVIK